MEAILLTGSTGFVGSVTRRRLENAGHKVRGAGFHSIQSVEFRIPLEPDSDWSHATAGMSAVVHLAARTHVLNDRIADPLAEFRRVNTDSTLNLARTAARAGVRRFVFVSSIGVNGPMGTVPLSEEATPRPRTPYAISKLEAERGLAAIGHETGMEITILRPPLTYGPFVKARFLQLMNLVKAAVPLPFGSVRNLRSFVGVDNLADAIAVAVSHPRAAHRTFFVTDNGAISTCDLVVAMGQALGRPARLLPVPVPVLQFLGRVTGKADEVDRLVGSLVADSGLMRATLGWSPPKTFVAGLTETAEWLLGAG